MVAVYELHYALTSQTEDSTYDIYTAIADPSVTDLDEVHQSLMRTRFQADVQAAEDALVAEIAGLDDAADVAQYSAEYAKPASGMFDRALAMVAPTFSERAAAVAAMAPDGEHPDLILSCL